MAIPRPGVRRRNRRLAATIAASVPLVLGAAGPATAGPGTKAVASAAAVIHVNRPCYVRTSRRVPRMTLTGSGFVPGGQVTVTDSSGTLDATITAGATGALDATFAGPAKVLSHPGELRDTILASEPTTTGATVLGRTVTHLSILGAGHGATRSARGLRALTERADWVFSGWPLGDSIFVHYLAKGHAVARQRFGRPSAPCGVLHAKRPLYPTTPHSSAYRTQIDTHARYSPHTTPRFTQLRVGLELEATRAHDAADR